MRKNANEYLIPYSLSVLIDSFAIMADWQKLTVLINAGNKTIKTQNYRYNKYLRNIVSTIINTHILSFHNTFAQVPIL